MRVAYFDCFSGISGDMALGALVACGVSADDLRADLASLHLPGWHLDAADVTRGGIGAVDVTVRVAGHEAHGRHLADIEALLGGASLPARARERAMAVFRKLAEAEATVHRTTPDRIHFHEVGAVDAIVDIAGTCAALERLGVDRVQCSPLPMGHGFVECAHGTIPLPAPAVVELARGLPVYGVDTEGELVTPTGAALMAALAETFGPVPQMRVETLGYGAGKKEFGNRPNLLRVVVGENSEPAADVVAIETNLDDLSPQFYDVLSDRLFEAGALDVFTAPIQMKKGRPAILLTVLSPPERSDALAAVVFQETTTLGLRMHTARRLCLDRTWVTVGTPFGDVRVKVGSWHGAETTASPEYEDVKAAALAHGVPVKAVHQAAVAAYLARR